jgi:filamentous hemagglutinin family protein
MKKGRSRGAWERKLLALAVASCFSAELAHANPVGPTVTHGKATFATRGNALTVTNTPGAIINWQSFGIASQEITRFLQQSGASAVLNRVTGATPSAILGQLQSNGRVYLINPNGITIGKNAVIDVAGFVASTHRLSDEDFIKQRHRFQETPAAGAVINHGAIKTASGGMVYLVGQNIENHGVISTPQGQIILAAGRSIELVDAGTPEIRVQITASNNEALNLGELLATGGQIGMYAGLVRHGGTASANTAVVGENGKIVFKATKDVKLDAGSVTTASGPTAGSIGVEAKTGTAIVAGTVEANAAADRGGSIDLSGQQGVTIDPRGRISATGINGGTIALNSSAGEVRVSGELSASATGARGGSVVVTGATLASVAAGAKISVSGTKGGGSVSVSAGEDVRLDSERRDGWNDCHSSRAGLSRHQRHGRRDGHHFDRGRDQSRRLLRHHSRRR